MRPARMTSAWGKPGSFSLAGCLAVLLVTVVCSLLGIRNGLRPEQTAQITLLFPRLMLRDFRPEPLERAQCLGFFVGTYFAAVLTVLRPPRPISLRIGRLLFRAGLVVAVVAVLGFGSSSFGHANLKNPIFLELLPPGDRFYPWLFTVFVFLAPFGLPAGRMQQVLVKLLAVGLLALVAYSWLAITLVEPVRAVGYDPLNLHIAAALHSVVQSALGEIPYRDFTPQYGGYGLFVRPFLEIGSDGWGQVTLFMAVGMLLTLGFLVGSIYLLTRSWLVAALGGILYLWLIQPYLGTPYFQVGPIRTLFPTAFLFAFAASSRNDNVAAVVTGTLGPVAIFLNPESGVFAVAATLAALALWGGVRWREERRFLASVRPLLLFVTAFVLGGGFGLGLFRLGTGYLLGVDDLFGYSALFAWFGFYNLKMPDPGSLGDLRLRLLLVAVDSPGARHALVVRCRPHTVKARCAR